MVVPSIWYENNPLSVIESLCMGTPVIGAEVGGIPELIREGDGMLFRMGDKEELASAIVSVMSKDNVDTQGIDDEPKNDSRRNDIGRNSRMCMTCENKMFDI